jgi:hypothetical protein
VILIWECSSTLASKGQAPAARTESVWTSLPVTMFRKVGVMTETSVWSGKAKRRGTTPSSTTSWQPFVGTVSEVGQSPASIGENIFVVVINKVSQSRKKLPDCRYTGRRLLVMTEVWQSPSDITQECCLKITSKRKITKCSHDSINMMTAKLTEVSGLIRVRRRIIIPSSMTWSRSSGPSPAILPRAQTDCSA